MSFVRCDSLRASSGSEVTRREVGKDRIPGFRLFRIQTERAINTTTIGKACGASTALKAYRFRTDLEQTGLLARIGRQKSKPSPLSP